MNRVDMPEMNAMNVAESRPFPEDRTLRVSIVIVVWNARAYVLECLESLREYCAGVYSEVIVVDNASTDGTPDMVAERFPEFQLIRNSENLGFARANNIGMSRCIGEFVCLVNSDVKFTSDCITPMLDYLAAHADVGMVGPQMLGADGEVRRSTMRFPTVWNSFSRALGLDVVFKRSSLFGGMMMSDFDHLRTRPVEVLNGWFVLARRSAIERVGLFDPQFFMYGEDVDWSYRFNQAGQKLVFFAETGAIHYGGASSAQAPVRFHLELYRATWQYWRKHRGWLAQRAFLGITALHHGIRAIGAALSRLNRAGGSQNAGLHWERSIGCLRWVMHTFWKKSANPPFATQNHSAFVETDP
jgi:GT2 family glycosyltransferase